MSQLYSDVLSDHEAALGFEKVYLNNPHAGFYGHGSIIPAVVFRLGDCDLIIKMNNPQTGSPEYSHQIYGTYGFNGTAEWSPVDVPIPSAELAINAARSGRDQAGFTAQKVNPGKPRMPLRCPKCSHEFALGVDVVPFESRQSCPACAAEDGIAKFDATNM